MYCPKCFDLSLCVAESGVLHISVNDIKRDTAQVLFNTGRETKEKLAENILKAIDDFFSWYAGLQNHEPIHSVSIFTRSYHCQNGCTLPSSTPFDVVGVLISKKWLLGSIHQLADKYGLAVNLPQNFLDE